MKIKSEDDRRFNKLTEAAQKKKIRCPHCGTKTVVPFKKKKKLYSMRILCLSK